MPAACNIVDIKLLCLLIAVLYFKSVAELHVVGSVWFLISFVFVLLEDVKKDISCDRFNCF